MNEFKLLKALSNLFYVLGWCVVVISILAGVSIASSYNSLGILPGVGVILGGIIVGTSLLAFSSLILLFLQIEKNTRKEP